MAKRSEHEYKFNPNLPADAIELAPTEQPKVGDYYEAPPEKRPINVSNDYVLTRIFQGTTFLGWGYMPKKTVAGLHKLSPTRLPSAALPLLELVRVRSLKQITEQMNTLSLRLRKSNNRVTIHDLSTLCIRLSLREEAIIYEKHPYFAGASLSASAQAGRVMPVVPGAGCK
jgi:hypothetical protein